MRITVALTHIVSQSGVATVGKRAVFWGRRAGRGRPVSDVIAPGGLLPIGGPGIPANHSGSANAQNPSPEAMATYCRPPTMYVMGEAFQSWFA